MKVADLLLRAQERLASSGISDSRIDAALLLEYVLDKDRTFLKAHGDEDVKEEESVKYKELVEKRAQRIPLQYLTGRTWFMGLEFEVNSSVLIPRFDTEFVTEEALKDINDGDRVLDLCTGSGCILLSLMSYKNDIEGVGTDISDKALETAKRNAQRLGKNPVLLQSDMFEKVEGRFDCIVSNPPYIKSADIEGLEDEVRVHEPKGALDGGRDGLYFYRVIAEEGCKYLTGYGRMILEIGYDQGMEVRDIFKEKGYRDIEIIRDYSGNERVMKCLNR